ncbi:hypothetical protein ACKVWC_000992 [Pyricularia oryzae]
MSAISTKHFLAGQGRSRRTAVTPDKAFPNRPTFDYESPPDSRSANVDLLAVTPPAYRHVLTDGDNQQHLVTHGPAGSLPLF